jgi:outer membrane cobalamin receptor
LRGFPPRFAAVFALLAGLSWTGMPHDGLALAESEPAELAPLVIEEDKPADAALVERSFETPDDVAAFGETIFAEPVWRSFESPAELLGHSVGAQVRRQGGRDDFATLSIRGAPSGQLRILLDGLSIGRASDTVVNLADLPFDIIERIEVYRGFAPVSLIPTSAAGVINVITRDPSAATKSAAIGAGSFGSVKTNAGAAGPLLGGTAAAFASYRHTDGDFEYLDDNGTPENPGDDRRQKRRNNDSDTLDSLLRWKHDLGETMQLQLRNQLFRKDEGVPGIALFDPTTTARLETVREIASAAISGRDRRWSVEQSATFESEELREFGAFDNTGETTSTTTAGRWSRPIAKSHWLSASADYSWEDFEQRSDDERETADRSSLAVGIGDDWTIAPLRSTLIFQLRHQQLWNSGALAGGSDHSTDPRAGIRVEPFGGLAIKSNVSSYFRPPTFDELFGTDGFTIGNPDLRAESGIAWDAGFEWKGGRDPFGDLQVGYAYFGSDVDDLILIIPNFQRRQKAQNEDRARIRGHEARLRWKGPAGLAVDGNYTVQDAENRSPDSFLFGRELAGVAPHEGYVRLSWSWRRFVVAYDVEVTGAHFIDRENVRAKLPTRTVHGLELVYGPFFGGFRMTLECENLGDTLVPDPLNFPLPGRAFYATLSWSPAGRLDVDVR